MTEFYSKSPIPIPETTIDDENISSPMNAAVALHTYRPKCEDELYLTTGQTIRVLSINPTVSGSEGWWVGQNNHGHVGVFPANYVELLVPIANSNDTDRRNFSEGQGSSLLDSADSLALDTNSNAYCSAKPQIILDSTRGTEDSDDDDVRLRHNYDYADLSHLRTFNCGDIVIGKSIGAGSFGTVYQGTWLNQTVAIKVYHQSSSSQVVNEAFNLSQLSHANVVTFLGLWESPSQPPAIVMEFAHGGSLQTLIRQRPTLYPATILDWLIQIAGGMRYLHEDVGLVHRDLKTANILIQEPLVTPLEPEDLKHKCLLISDLGMSCSLADAASGLKVSGVGTAAYAAPEVICLGHFSFASDVWSYGVVLWEIFLMLEPFKEFDRAQQLVNIGRNRQKLCIPRTQHGFPEVIEFLLTYCWDDEKAFRPYFSDVIHSLYDIQEDPFFSLSVEEFTEMQDAWRYEILEASTSNILSESCSSRSSSPLRQQNETLQRENAQMRDALHALQLKEEGYLGTIADLQERIDYLHRLGSRNSSKKTTPAPRKRPFVRNLFRRNEPKQEVSPTLTVPQGDNHGKSMIPNRTSPTGLCSTSSFVFIPATSDSHPANPTAPLSSSVHSPSCETTDAASYFAFLYTRNGEYDSEAPLTLKTQRPRLPGSIRLISYKSAPELSDQVGCSQSNPVTQGAFHMLSKDFAFEPSSSSSRRQNVSTSAVSSHTLGPVSKRHRMSLSALFHPSRSKHNSTSSKLPSPVIESTPQWISTDTSPSTHAKPPFVNLGSVSSVPRSANNKQKISNEPRRFVLSKIFQTDRNRQKRVGGGNKKSIPVAKKKRGSISPEFSTVSHEQVRPCSSEAEISSPREVSQNAFLVTALQFPPLPPLPPHLSRHSNCTREPRRRLLDLVSPPLSSASACTATPIPRPCTLSASDVNDKSVALRGRFRTRNTFQSSNALFRPTGQSENVESFDTVVGTEVTSNDTAILWSDFPVTSTASVSLNYKEGGPGRFVSISLEPPATPQSAPITQVPFSLFDSNDGGSPAVSRLGKAQSCLERFSYTSPLTVDWNRRSSRRQWKVQRALSAPVPNSSKWRRKLIRPSPVFYSPPPNYSNATYSRCRYYSEDESPHFSLATISSKSPFPWMPVDNLVALSGDSYLQVTEDSPLSHTPINSIDSLQSPSTTPIKSTPSAVVPSPLFPADLFLLQKSRNRPSYTSFLHSPVSPAVHDFKESTLDTNGSTEDKTTLYAEIQQQQQLPHKISYDAVFEGATESIHVALTKCPLTMTDKLLHSVDDGSRHLLSFPCRRRGAFRLKDRIEEPVSSPEVV